MYRSHRSFNIGPPPPSNPPGIWLFWKLLFKFPPSRTKMPFKCPTLGSIQVITCPHPGDISQAHKWKRDGRNAFSCQQIICSQYNKNWETLLAYLLRTTVLCKAAEIFVCHATYKAFCKKKSHLLRLPHHDHFTDMHLINHRRPKLTLWGKGVM